MTPPSTSALRCAPVAKVALPPPITVQELLAEARATLERVPPAALRDVLAAGGVALDMRSDDQIAQDGPLPGAVRVGRNVLEWRCDPASPWRDERVCDPARVLVLVCDEGYSSSLAAATLQRLGLPLATDLIGGFRALRRAGLAPPPADRG